MNQKSILMSLGIGVGAAAVVGGAVLSYIHFNNQDDLDYKGHVSSRPHIIKMKIAEKDAGAVIGKGGSNVRSIQDKTNTKIHFLDELATDTERFIQIRGCPEDVQLAEILILQSITNQPKVETLILKVPNSCVGRIIGKKGDNIRRIQTLSRCRVDISKEEPIEGKKPIKLIGTDVQLSIAKRLVLEEVEREMEVQDQIRDCAQKRPPRLKPHKEQLFLTSDTEISSSSESNDPYNAYELLIVNYGEKTAGVFISSVLNPENFHVQKVGPNSVLLDKLVQDMTNFYSSDISQKLNSVNELCKGDIVAAVYPGDNQWYRCKVTSILTDEYDDSEVNVGLEFLDFGDTDIKGKSEIFLLKDEFKKLKFQAIKCSLNNVQPLGANWTNDAIEAFEKLTQCSKWKEIQAQVMDFKPVEDDDDQSEHRYIPIVQLYDSDKSEDFSIGEELVRMGHAKFIEEPNKNPSGPSHISNVSENKATVDPEA